MKTHRWYPWLFGTATVVLIALLPLFMAQPQGSGFNAFRQYISSAVAPDVGLQQNALIKYHQLLWTVTGAPAACTVALDSSVDGVSWTAGGAIAGQTCTSNGQSAITGIVQVNYVRINLTAFSGGSSPTITVNYEGWAYNPSGGGSGTVSANSGSAGAIGVYAAAGGSTTIGPDTTLNDSGTVLTYSGTNVVIPVGTAAQPDLQATGSAANTGIALTTSAACFSTTGNLTTCSGSGFTLALARVVGWASSTSAGVAPDTGLSRASATVIDVGNGTAGNATGTMNLASVQVAGVTLLSSTAPTIAGAGCGGSAASIVTGNTAAFKVNVGATPGSACTITMPAATTGWNCTANDITTQSTGVFLQKQTGAESTTSVVITNFSDVAAATAFTASDILKVQCSAD
jgi:hypothetical protein